MKKNFYGSVFNAPIYLEINVEDFYLYEKIFYSYKTFIVSLLSIFLVLPTNIYKTHMKIRPRLA